VLFVDTVDANEIGNELDSGKGVWFMISLGVIVGFGNFKVFGADFYFCS